MVNDHLFQSRFQFFRLRRVGLAQLLGQIAQIRQIIVGGVRRIFTGGDVTETFGIRAGAGYRDEAISFQIRLHTIRKVVDSRNDRADLGKIDQGKRQIRVINIRTLGCVV